MVTLVHLTKHGLYSPKCRVYEYKQPLQRSRNKAAEFLQQHNRAGNARQNNKAIKLHCRLRSFKKTRNPSKRNYQRRKWLFLAE